MNIYKKNIEALGKNHPELVELMESTIIDEDRIKVLPADNDLPRVLYRKENGEEVYIHSADDPAKCANQAIDLLGKMEKEGVAILFGFGLGYFAEEVLKQFEKGHQLLVYEATPALFKTALQTRDISGLLESEKVKVILGDNAEIAPSLASGYNHIINGRFWIVKHHPSVKLNEEAYDSFLQKTMDAKQVLDTGIGTAIVLGKDFMDTFMANIPHILRKTGVSGLKDIFKGRPAIIVSGGPSLDKNLHLLKKAKGRATIIAVDAVLSTLIPAGILPDVVTGVDPTPEAMALFKDNPLLKKVPFICLPQYAREVVGLYPGPVFVNSVPGNIIFQWLNSFWEDKGYIEAFGGSVAHFAFSAATYMGADVIALIGQDLSYADKYHAGETTALLHEYLNEEVPDYTKNAQVVDDIFGEKRYTTGALLSFKTIFEKKFSEFQGTIINATEGGLPLEGTRIMRLADFINKYCSHPEMDTSPLLYELTKGDVSYNLDGLLLQVTTAKSMFMEIKRHAKKILRHVHKLIKMQEKEQEEKPEFHNILRKIEKLTDDFKYPILDIISSYHYSLELHMSRQEVLEIDSMEDKKEKLDKQLSRGLKYYGELIEAISLFTPQLNKLASGLAREKKVNTALMDESLPEAERFRRAGMICKRAGMVAPAVRNFESAMTVENAKTGPMTRSLYIPLAEMYAKQFRFQEALDMLNKAGDKIANKRGQKEKISEVLKTCNEKIKDWDNKNKHSDKLLKKAETDYGSDFESGYFYFRVKDYEMAEKAYEKAVADNSSSAAYYGLAHTYLAMNEPEQAVSALEKALETDPENPVIYRDLGYIAIQNDDKAAAEMFLTKAIELAPQAEDLYKPLGSLYLSLDKMDKAISLYENALLVNPDSPVIQQGLASLIKSSIKFAGKH